MTRPRAEILRDLRAVNDKINEAFSRFCMTARAKPPSMVVPEAYRRRAELEEELKREGSAG